MQGDGGREVSGSEAKGRIPDCLGSFTQTTLYEHDFTAS
jgi:hypothetical protein